MHSKSSGEKADSADPERGCLKVQNFDVFLSLFVIKFPLP